MKISVRAYRIIAKILLALVILVVVAAVAFLGLQLSGKNRLYQKNGNGAPVLSEGLRSEKTSEEGSGNETLESGELIAEENAQEAASQEESNWQEGDVRYQGIHYRYNSEILTFLFLGIDKMEEVKDAKNGIDGGQSDAIFLLILNPKTKEASVIGVNRDTMTDIDVYSKDGNFIGTTTGQLTLQHGYGDGREQSCERSMKAVSSLFYNLPIHGYCAINMGAIPLINDAVGGVEITALENVKNEGRLLFKEGENVHLKGMNAYYYLKVRDTESFESAGRRLERQKQYLTAYAAAAMEAIKKDITLPVTLYSTLSKYMVTDITIDEVSYLATQAAGYSFKTENMYSLEGETLMGEKFEEFYADDKALYELILKVFYEQVED